jgi:dTDP-4-amino-4,6-dideoxygalactose transaminase
MACLRARGEDIPLIPCANPKAQYLAHKQEIDNAARRVLESGWYILGDEVRSFEEEFAAYLGVTHCIGVGNGTEALHLALVACGIGHGDEVATVSHTAVATVAAIELAGAKPVFVDIDPGTYTMDPGLLKNTITSKTRAVIPVHLYGHPASMEGILAIARENGLFVIEDCAQAHGAIYQGKRVGSFAERARLIREYGWAERYVSHIPGWNTRLDEIQAAILRVKLKNLDLDNSRRIQLAKRYSEGLYDLEIALPVVHKDAVHVYHLYVIRVKERDALQAYFHSKGIGTAVHYPVPVHLQPAYEKVATNLPNSEIAAREVLSLPMYPELAESQVQFVVDSVREYHL